MKGFPNEAGYFFELGFPSGRFLSFLILAEIETLHFLTSGVFVGGRRAEVACETFPQKLCVLGCTVYSVQVYSDWRSHVSELGGREL